MAKPGNRGHLVVFQHIPQVRRKKPIILKACGWQAGSGLTTLECESCHYKFSLESNPKNRWLPEKEPKFCLGCGHPIKGCRLPYGRNPKARFERVRSGEPPQVNGVVELGRLVTELESIGRVVPSGT